MMGCRQRVETNFPRFHNHRSAGSGLEPQSDSKPVHTVALASLLGFWLLSDPLRSPPLPLILKLINDFLSL